MGLVESGGLTASIWGSKEGLNESEAMENMRTMSALSLETTRRVFVSNRIGTLLSSDSGSESL